MLNEEIIVRVGGPENQLHDVLSLQRSLADCVLRGPLVGEARQHQGLVLLGDGHDDHDVVNSPLHRGERTREVAGTRIDVGKDVRSPLDELMGYRCSVPFLAFPQGRCLDYRSAVLENRPIVFPLLWPRFFSVESIFKPASEIRAAVRCITIDSLSSNIVWASLAGTRPFPSMERFHVS